MIGGKLLKIGKSKLLDMLRLSGEVIVVLENKETGKKRTYKTRNIVTNAGDTWYAQEICGEAQSWDPAGLRLGTNAGSASAPTKTDVKMQTTTGSTPIGGTGDKAVDGGYPKTNDDDTDNPGGGVDIVTWRFSYGTGDANQNNIATIDMPDTFTDGSIAQSLAIANFAAKFNKTSSDTLKVFVNHEMLGV